MIDYKERNNFYELPFWNASFPCENAFEKYTTKTSGTSQYNYLQNIAKLEALSQ